MSPLLGVFRGACGLVFLSGSGEPELQSLRRCFRRARACPSPSLVYPQASRGTGPRATVRKKLTEHHADFVRGMIAGPRATVRKKPSPGPVGRGPVPRQATIAGETRSPARVETCEGPRPTVRKKPSPGPVGRGPVPRHATIAGDRPPHYGSSV